ncbi:MAG: hypothetical protein WD071_06785 [Pseudohongiella sp.]|uniref:hypothetical protein n=1 Tax=Pseudohongiella sp. TaxID=1979412 RepID=UPI0034A06F88
MTQTDGSYHFWDTIIKAATAIAVSSSVVIASCQYKEKVENEYMAPIWKKQVEVYSKAATLASDAATVDDTDKQIELLEKLRKVYLSELQIVGDSSVTVPAAKFINELDECIESGDCRERNLMPLASSIARCARKSLGKSWDRGFDELSEDNPMQAKPNEMCK